MSTSCSPRIKRGPPPKKLLTDSNYRRASRFEIKRDFGQRCAYSDLHEDYSQGKLGLEIDHFNPTITGRDRHRYRNLLQACRLCNNKKRDAWPTKNQQKLGLRFINPCEEQDYGTHLIERATHELEGLTPAGLYHIDGLGLNAKFFVRHREQRNRLMKLLNNLMVIPKRPLGADDSETLILAIEELKTYLSNMIRKNPN